MNRHVEQVSERQHQLALDSISSGASHAPLRTAYARLQMSRQLTFEQAMSIPVFAIGIRNLADAMTRSAKTHSSRYEREH